MKKKFNVLIIGFGYWGPILARNFQSNLKFNVASVCDSNSFNLSKAKNIYPDILYFKSYKKALMNPDIDLVVVATPTDSHFTIVKSALNKKKHVMCEKPLSLKLQKVNQLIKLSKKNKRFLFVDYPFIYSESVDYIKRVFKNKKLGKPLIYESIREKAPYRKDTNVIWDLGIHDLSILQYLLNDTPINIKVNTLKSKKNFKSDFANINLLYKNKFNAFIKLNWLSPLKTRIIKIYFQRGLLIYDENEGIYKVNIYKKSKRGYNLQIPLISRNETLKLFVKYIEKTILNSNIKKFNFNFSINLTKTILKITNNV